MERDDDKNEIDEALGEYIKSKRITEGDTITVEDERVNANLQKVDRRLETDENLELYTLELPPFSEKNSSRFLVEDMEELEQKLETYDESNLENGVYQINGVEIAEEPNVEKKVKGELTYDIQNIDLYLPTQSDMEFAYREAIYENVSDEEDLPVEDY